MLATIQSRTFCLVICNQRTQKIKIYKTITTPEVLHGYETFTQALKEESGLEN
jgi:hypothetical protein